jgi:hypothetical protein
LFFQCSLVRPNLEHVACVWLPHQSVHSERLEHVQHNFIRYAVRRLPWRVWPLPALRCSPTGKLSPVLALRGTFWLAGSIVRILLSCYDLRRFFTQGGVTRDIFPSNLLWQVRTAELVRFLWRGGLRYVPRYSKVCSVGRTFGHRRLQ